MIKSISEIPHQMIKRAINGCFSLGEFDQGITLYYQIGDLKDQTRVLLALISECMIRYTLSRKEHDLMTAKYLLPELLKKCDCLKLMPEDSLWYASQRFTLDDYFRGVCQFLNKNQLERLAREIEDQWSSYKRGNCKTRFAAEIR